jgi:hypothetical protein
MDFLIVAVSISASNTLHPIFVRGGAAVAAGCGKMGGGMVVQG